MIIRHMQFAGPRILLGLEMLNAKPIFLNPNLNPRSRPDKHLQPNSSRHGFGEEIAAVNAGKRTVPSACMV